MNNIQRSNCAIRLCGVHVCLFVCMCICVCVCMCVCARACVQLLEEEELDEETAYPLLVSIRRTAAFSV